MALCNAGFPVGRSHLAFLIHDLKKFQRLAQASSSRLPVWAQAFALSGQSRAAIAFSHQSFPRWDKRIDVFLSFGPLASWEALGRFDASTTTFGCGGILWVPGAPCLRAFYHKWSKEDERFGQGKEVVSSGVMEGLAALWWMRVFARHCCGKRLLLEGDNTATMQAIRKGYSPSPGLMKTVHRVCQSEARHRIVIRTRAILGQCPQAHACTYNRPSLCTHCAHTVHTLCTRCAHSVHTQCTHCAHTVHTLCTLCARTVHTLCTHCAHIVHTLCTHCAHTEHTLSTHCAHTVHTLCTHCAHTVHPLCTNCAHTVHTRCSHCAHTVHALCTQ